MSLIMTTSSPEVNAQGIKRWYLGDVQDDSQHVYLFESTPVQRQQTGCTRYLVRTFTDSGDVVREQFFKRSHSLYRQLQKLFKVDVIELGGTDREEELLDEAA